MTTLETASLILTLLAHDDACTARELAVALGTTAAALRPALRQLVEGGDVVTSGRAGATRYVLAVDEEQPTAPVQPADLVLSAAVVAQRAERSSSASLVLADEEPAVELVTRALVQEAVAAGHADVQYRRRLRGERRIIPATLDLESALTATRARLESGASLAELSARPLPQPAPLIARALVRCGRESRDRG